jgi:Arc/MetJ-type ribon-helix-helix transcriptional regulator
MKILTVRLPDALVAEIEAEARRRTISKSDVVRERLTRPLPSAAPPRRPDRRPRSLDRRAAERPQREPGDPTMAASGSLTQVSGRALERP